jgi:Low molecular weight phosphotyrosine protein phosphatase
LNLQLCNNPVIFLRYSYSTGPDEVRVFFVCVHNLARSQIAEAFQKHSGEALFDVEHAGFEPGRVKSSGGAFS